jgi:capsular polysaccharide biosynthesis protein
LVVELRRYLAILRRRLVLIVVTVIGAMAAAGAATPRTPHYAATAVIYAGPRSYSLNTSGPANNADVLQGINGVLTTFTKMIGSEPIAAEAVSTTGVGRSPARVVGQTSVTIEPSTQLLDVQVKDTDPSVAERLANGVADAFVTRVQTLQPDATATQGTAPAVPAYVFQRAKSPTSPESNGLMRNVGLAGLFALVLSVGLAFLLEYLDVTIKGPDDIEHELELPVLAIVPAEIRGA